MLETFPSLLRCLALAIAESAN